MESYYQRSPMRASQVRGNTWRLSKQEHKNAVCGVCVCGDSFHQHPCESIGRIR
jgi:hypothetical protein